MTVRFAQWTVDVRDVETMSTFWAAALGYRVDAGDDGCAKLYPPGNAPPDVPTMWLQAADTPKQAKNRLHPDLRPVDGDVEAEVERLMALGARRVDVGQTDADAFVVLADPEGDEFCVLRNEPRRD